MILVGFSEGCSSQPTPPYRRCHTQAVGPAAAHSVRLTLLKRSATGHRKLNPLFFPVFDKQNFPKRKKRIYIHTMTMANPEKTICVFCGSSFGKDQVYADSAAELGKLLAARSWGLVYGGGSTGLMGAVARGCATNGGYVHGVIPEALISRERTTDEQFNQKLKEGIDHHDGSTPIPDSAEYGKTTLVKDMHTRKRMMGQEAHAFVALPGGYGTMEELLEMITWHQLNIHSKPIVIYNIDGFFDNFLKFVNDSVEAEFVSRKNKEIIKVATTAEGVLKAIEEYQLQLGRFTLNWEST